MTPVYLRDISTSIDRVVARSHDSCRNLACAAVYLRPLSPQEPGVALSKRPDETDRFLWRIQRILKKVLPPWTPLARSSKLPSRKLLCERLSISSEPLVFTGRSCRAQLRLMESGNPEQSAEGQKIAESLDALGRDLTQCEFFARGCKCLSLFGSQQITMSIWKIFGDLKTPEDLV